MSPHPPRLLSQVPDELLLHRKAASLAAWCLNRGIRPTLLQIETERAARARHTPPTSNRRSTAA